MELVFHSADLLCDRLVSLMSYWRLSELCRGGLEESLVGSEAEALEKANKKLEMPAK